jgi:hypothetical protein
MLKRIISFAAAATVGLTISGNHRRATRHSAIIKRAGVGSRTCRRVTRVIRTAPDYRNQFAKMALVRFHQTTNLIP